LWIEQAFAVAAGIILSLDTFHRASYEVEFAEHDQLITDTIAYLNTFENSKIATRGVQLLSALQQELNGIERIESRKRTRSVGETASTPSPKRRTVNIRTLIRNVSQNLGVTPPATTPDTETMGGAVDDSWDAFLDLLPPNAGFDGPYLFDDLLSNHS
jgi:hypothetical protein